ncbi:MAG: hypothetical protein OXF61_10950 [Acidimicrobiaceae bacterium]|nr:hypothetical protein [Acidimicrobiaceae bacterium]
MADVRHRRVVRSESDQVGDEFADLSQRNGADVRARHLNDAVDAERCGQVRLGDTEAGDVDFA